MPRESYDYGFNRPRPARRRRSPESRWRFGLWTLVCVCGIISLVLLALARLRDVFSIIAVCYGGLLVVVAIVLVFMVSSHEEQQRPPGGMELGLAAAAGFLGGMIGGILYVMLRHSIRWPQPLVTLILALGTIAGGLLIEPRRAEKADAPPAQQPQQPQQQPPAGQPKTDPPKKPQGPKLEPGSLDAPFDADPAALASGPTVYLVKLKPFAFQNSPWKLGIGVKGEDLKTPIYYEKKTYTAGISMHPPINGACRVSFVPGKQFKRFKGGAAIGDGGAPWSPVIFAVWGDSRKLWESSGIRSGAVGFDIDVTGVTVLVLETRMQDGLHHAAYAVWLDPWLER